MFKSREDYTEHYRKYTTDPAYRDNYLRLRRQESEQEAREKLLTVERFQTSSDVPPLPKVEAADWNQFYIPTLIKKGALPKDQMEDGVWYYGNYRNSDLGRWNKVKSKFDHIRYKFGYRWDDCNHFEDDNGFALFVPLRKATRKEVLEIEQIISTLPQTDNADTELKRSDST